MLAMANSSLAKGGDDEDGDEDGDEDASPTKKKKATPGKAKGKKKPAADDEDVSDTVVVKSELADQAGDDGSS